MKKRAKQVLVLALALSMLAGLSVGCKKDDDSSQADSGNASNQSTEQSSQADSTPDNGEIVTIQFYGGGANPSSTYYEWQQEYFEENLGLRVETIVSDKEKLQPMLAAGNLPDLGLYAVDGDPTQAIEGGHVMDLTDYEDQIPNYTEKHPQSVQYSKDYKSAGTGKLYAIITQIGIYNAYPMDVGCYAANIRWDIYEKAGKPEVTDMYTFLDALKKMQEVYPETEDGQKTYAMGFYPSWDGTHMSNAARYTAVMGISGQVVGYNQYSIIEDKIMPMIEKGSYYYESLKWMSTANRMGLIDPDSMTQTYEITQAKTKDSGQYLASMTGNYCDGYNTNERVNGDDPSGFMPLIWDGQHPVVNGETVIGGDTNNPLFVSSTTKELEACLRFVNMMFDEDALMVMYGGPQGELWDIVDGKYVLTDAADAFQQTGSHTFATGESSSDWWGCWGLASATKNSKYNSEFRISDQAEYTERKIENNKIVDMYEEYYGYRRPIQVWTEKDLLCYEPEWRRLIETMPADLQDIQNNVKGIVCEYSWKIVMTAKDDSEIDSMFDEMKAQCDALGIQQIVDWGKNQIETAKANIGKYE